MRRRLCITLVATGLTIGRAYCLTDEEVFRDFQFNTINPGARSLALGGAFISLADDATAAQANPSGLSYLLKQEYFVELRGTDNGQTQENLQDSNFPAGAQISVLTGSSLDDARNMTFASAVFPIKKLTLGISRQLALNNQATTLNSFSLVIGSGTPEESIIQASGGLDVTQTNYNASLGFRVNDKLAFGASVVFGQLSVDTETSSYIFDPSGNLTGSPVLEPTLDLKTTIHDDDTDIGYSIGSLFRPSANFSFGAVFRKAPKFSVEEEIAPGGQDYFGVEAVLGQSFTNEFNVPDSYGIGASWQPYQFLTLSMDIERIEYSDLVDGFVAGVNPLTEFDAVFTADDGTDYRIGGEYIFQLQNAMILAARAGVFTQADSTIYALSTGTGVFATPASFPSKDREIRGALGLGVGIGRQQIDMGLSLGNSTNEFVISYIFKGK